MNLRGNHMKSLHQNVHALISQKGPFTGEGRKLHMMRSRWRIRSVHPANMWLWSVCEYRDWEWVLIDRLMHQERLNLPDEFDVGIECRRYRVLSMLICMKWVSGMSWEREGMYRCTGDWWIILYIGSDWSRSTARIVPCKWDQVWLICIQHNGHHTCMYMYIVLTVFPDEVIVSISEPTSPV